MLAPNALAGKTGTSSAKLQMRTLEWNPKRPQELQEEITRENFRELVW